MKKLAILLPILYLFVSSCSNDFELTDDWKDIAVVYGLINPSDTAQYVKVGKAFLDPSTSSLVIAQIPDSLYYQDVTVELKELSATGEVDNTIQMFLVDANLEGFPKPEGVFASSPNYVFKTKDILNTAKTYRIEIKNSETSSSVTAETGIIGDFEVTRPRSRLVNPNSRLNWVVGSTTTFRWQIPENAAFYDLTLEILFDEIYDDGSTILRKLVWELEKSVVSDQSNSNGQSFSLGYDGEDFYQFMNNSLDPNPDFCRKMRHFNVRVNAGGEELYKYINAGEANSGITSTLPLPDYTNLSNEGRGIFSTRNSSFEEFVNVDGSINTELITNPLTSDLGFITQISNCN